MFSVKAVALLLLVFLVASAGCSTTTPQLFESDRSSPAGEPEPTQEVDEPLTGPPDTLPWLGGEEETIGRENGIWHNASIDVNASDGLDEEEQRAYLSRTMARVEFIRGHEFTRSIDVEVVTREEVKQRVERTGSFASDEALSERRLRIMNVFWEALFFVGEDEDAAEVRATEASSFLGAYYRFGSDTIRVVTDEHRIVRIDERLLAHEFVHALQDEYAGTPLETRSDDDNYATAALIEGDAVVVTRLYAERCTSGTWECVEVPATGGSEASQEVHAGFRTLRSFAYSDGPAFVYHLYERGGWPAVDRAFENRPRTTEEIIHPERYPAESPVRPDIPPPSDGWEVMGGPYTVGEVELFGLFWYQDRTSGTSLVDTSFGNADRGRFDRYTFVSEPSAGWDGDGLTIVGNGKGQSGYVWVTQWDTVRDAEEFAAAHRRVLQAQGAAAIDSRTWMIPEGSYADAFAVVQDGRTVTIVNGPRIEDLSAIHPPLDRAE